MATIEEMERDTAPASKGFTFRTIRATADLLTNAFRGHAKRIAELERRLGELEGRQMRYVGTFESGRKYLRGEMVTDRGSLWHCEADTTTRPGESTFWTLAAKRGADGRDAR